MFTVKSDNNNLTKNFNSSTCKYSVLFDGLTIETTVTNEAHIVEEWIRLISSIHDGKRTVVGLDTEWMRDQNNKMKVAILQLCVEDKCLILQLSFMDNIPQSLRTFLFDSNFEFVGVGILLDIKKLKNEYDLECNNGTDVATVARTQCPGRFSSLGLKYLAKELADLDMKKSKEICTSKWESKELTQDQIEYACIDAYASYKIGKKLLIEEKLLKEQKLLSENQEATSILFC
ncbi:hypothetical protein VNO77_09522 [Canavalia gladiata]|uniref:3'-5' exonuclease domain-containing protein n=1 Tax=Canavalia gladiata TaxID=3824 RepID=A0AAN9MD44_CANGL